MNRLAAFLVYVSSIRVLAIQKHSAQSSRKWTDFTLLSLPDYVVAETESYCINGDTPTYYLREGSETGKWIIWLGQGAPCADEETCENKAQNEDDGTAIGQAADDWNLNQIPLANSGLYTTYNAVYIRNCDYGGWLGEKEGVYDASSGRKMYFRGKLILENVIAELQKSYTFEEVLLGGGSGGASSAYILGEKIKGLLGDSVTKFGVLAINGWFSDMDTDLAGDFALLHGMKSIFPSCEAQFSTPMEKLQCLNPSVAYKSAVAPTFVVQLFDKSVMNCDDAEANEDFEPAWQACLHCPDSSSTETCTQDMVDIIQPFWQNFSQSFQDEGYVWKQDFGGIISTCATHGFWNSYHAFISQMADDSTTTADAVSKWWSSIGTNASSWENWYQPCTMASAPSAQCEETCYADDTCAA